MSTSKKFVLKSLMTLRPRLNTLELIIFFLNQSTQSVQVMNLSVDQSELLHFSSWDISSSIEFYFYFCLENMQQFFLKKKLHSVNSQ